MAVELEVRELFMKAATCTQLTCEASGPPEPNINWTKVNQDSEPRKYWCVARGTGGQQE